ncbi:MAG TPA: O-antigen ligase domain-containing protein [Candidatus Marinimicrobia bacterium]|jgi:O-antigen ligase|nr:O-antigen ligase domain-containing protein [Candidatus Neomarinimicrobiota bacterium]
MLLLTVLAVVETILLFLGVITNPIIMVLIPLGLIILWWLINNPAITLMILSLTAIIKGYLINYFPVIEILDITVIATIIIWLGLVKILLEGNWKLPSEPKSIVYLFLIFGLLLGISYIYTASPDYGFRKILRFNTFAVTIFISPLLIIKSPADSKRLLSYFYFLLVIIIGIMLLQFVYFLKWGDFAIVLAYWNRISIPGANPIQVSRYLAIGAAMMIALLIRNKPSQSLHYFAILFVILLSIILSGSRGPLVSIIIGSIVYAILYERKHSSRIYGYGILAIGTIITLLLLLPESLTQRFFDISQGSVIMTQQGVRRISTIATRFEFWSMSLQAWFSSITSFFIGLGAGSFSSLFIWRDWRWYPHNLFFEIIVELGLIGLVIGILFIIKSYQIINKGIQRGSFTDHSALWVAGTVVMFIAAQFSGDINDNRILWMFIGISIASTHVDNLYGLGAD